MTLFLSSEDGKRGGGEGQERPRAGCGGKRDTLPAAGLLGELPLSGWGDRELPGGGRLRVPHLSGIRVQSVHGAQKARLTAVCPTEPPGLSRLNFEIGFGSSGLGMASQGVRGFLRYTRPAHRVRGCGRPSCVPSAGGTDARGERGSTPGGWLRETK